jgi:glycerol-3-phosphate dehydrogenase
VSPFPQLVPLLPQVNHRHAALVRAGFLAADALRSSAHTSRHTLPRSRRISGPEVQRFAPTVRTSGLRGGLLAWDGQRYDDARPTICIARTAAALGARVLTRCVGEQVTGHGAVLRDELTGRSHDVDARIVINAAGVWAGEVAPGIELRPSRGTHLVLSQESFGGLTVPAPGSTSRFVFALPAPDNHVYVGITDEDAPGDIPDVPLASEEEIDFLLETVSSALRSPLTRADLLGTFAGLRPLLHTGGDSTADISRRHAVITASDGLVTIVGGKLTTYRRMAQDALNAALDSAGMTAAPCSTRRLPLVGAASREALAALAAPARLVHKYGTEAVAVAGDTGGAEAICVGTETTAAELRFAVQHEGALDEDDLFDRRTRIGLDPVTRTRALEAARAALVSP